MPWKYLSVCYWFLNLAHSFFGYIKNNQPLDFFGRNDAKAESPVLWPPHAKSWLIGKDSDAGRDRGQEEKQTIEDEMAEWHHRLDGHEFEWTPGVGDGQGGLTCCSSWGCKESGMTERLNWTEPMIWCDENNTLPSWSYSPKPITPVQPEEKNQTNLISNEKHSLSSMKHDAVFYKH